MIFFNTIILLMILERKKHTDSVIHVKQKSKICVVQSEGFCNLLTVLTIHFTILVI